MVKNPAEVIEMVIEEVKMRREDHIDPRSLALVITHLEDALLRYNHANR